MNDALKVVSEKITSAKFFIDIFGTIPKGTVKTRLLLLHKQYRILAKMIHPDKVLGEEKDATAVFKLLNEINQKAISAIKNDYYEKAIKNHSGKPSPKTETTFNIKSSTTKYIVDTQPFKSGDFSSLHKAKTEEGKIVCIKIANDPTMNQYLEHEVKILNIFTSKKEINILEIRKFIPEILDTFIINGELNTKYRVLVTPYADGFMSLKDIKEFYPRGLNPKDVAWIWRRVITEALAASMIGVVHGAIVPDHILVHPITHNPLHIGWANSVIEPIKNNTHIITISNDWNEWYPKEVFKRGIASQQIDIYMAGKTLIYLLGGNVAKNTYPITTPNEIGKIIHWCTDEDPHKRPSNGLEVLNEFEKIIRKLWGKQYRKLVLPSS